MVRHQLEKHVKGVGGSGGMLGMGWLQKDPGYGRHMAWGLESGEQSRNHKRATVRCSNKPKSGGILKTEKSETSSVTRGSHTDTSIPKPRGLVTGSYGFTTADRTALTAGSELCTEVEQQQYKFAFIGHTPAFLIH